VLSDRNYILIYWKYKFFYRCSPWVINVKEKTLISCPLTAWGPAPTSLSQKARPEGATWNSHGISAAGDEFEEE